MLKTKTLISVLAMAAFTGAALAQTTGTTTGTTTETAPAAETAPAPETAPAQTTEAAPSDLDTGQPEGPQIGQPYIKEDVSDWQIQCIKQEEGTKEPCQLYQLLRGEEGNPVAEVIIEKLPEGGQVAAGGTIIVPLGTALARDMRIAVGNSQGKVYRYAFCDNSACFARIGFLAADVSAFKAGSSATLTIYSYERADQPVTLDISLAGFTAGYAKIDPSPVPAKPE